MNLKRVFIKVILGFIILFFLSNISCEKLENLPGCWRCYVLEEDGRGAEQNICDEFVKDSVDAKPHWMCYEME